MSYASMIVCNLYFEIMHVDTDVANLKLLHCVYSL